MYVQPIKPNTKQPVTPSALTQPVTLPCERSAGPSLGVPAPLGNTGRASLVAIGSQRRWARRQPLYHANNPAQAFYRITKGIVIEFKELRDGRRQIAAIRAAGGLCGYPARKRRYVLTGLAITPVEAQAFGAEEFTTHMARNLQFAGAVTDDVSERFHQTARLTVLGQLCSLERVAHFVLEMQELQRSRGTDTGPVELHLTREDIGNYLGLTMETVSRAFTKLKHLRLVAIASGGDVVVILDQKRLSELAEGF